MLNIFYMGKGRVHFFWKGTTLIESLIVIFVFSVMALTFYSSFSLGMVRILDAQRRLQAMSLANEQMERVRNIPYEDVGFDGSVPSCVNHCVMVPNEERDFGTGHFYISTTVQYEDDSNDGTLLSSTDAVPNDYKKVLISVEWGARSSEQHVEMVARFVPPGIEQEIPNTGALSINVYNNAGDPVSGVNVTITGIAGNFSTDNTGNLFLLGVPVSDPGYPIRLTKSGYEILETLPYPPVGAFPPKNPPVIVANGAINVGNFELNPLTDITFHAEDPFGNSFPNTIFLLSGGRRLDNNALPTDYEYQNESNAADANGDIHFMDRSGGVYVFSLDPSETDYIFWKSSVSGDDSKTVLFPYGGTVDADIILLKKTDPGILVKVVDDISGVELSGAEIHVLGNGVVYDATQMSDLYGFGYFPESENELIIGGSYDIQVDLVGYQSETETVTLAGLEEITISLQAD